MRKTLRLLAIVLAFVMIFAMLSACGGDNQGGETTDGGSAATTSTPTSAPAGGTEEPDEGDSGAMYPIAGNPTISIWNTASPDVYNNLETIANHQGYKAAAEKTGVTIEWTEASITQAIEQFAIMAVGGDYTDMIKSNISYYNTNGLSGALDEGMIVDIAEYLPEYAPDYWALLTSENAMRDAMTDNGNILAFYIVQENRVAANGLTIRADLLEEMGKDVPRTYDEAYEVLTAFKTEYGMSDPLFYQYANPMGGGVNSDLAAYLVGGYGVNWAFYQVDGQAKYGPLEDGFYDFLSMMNKWYSEGLINIDFHTRPTNTLDAENQAIFLNGQQGIAALTSSDITTIPKTQVTGNDNYRLVAMPDLTKDGTTHHLADVPTPLWSAMSPLTVTTACDDIETAVKWANFWYTDEGSLITNYGIEGVSFEYDNSGTPVFTDLIANNPDGMAYSVARQVYLLFTQIPNRYDMQNVYSFYNEDSKEASDIWTTGFDNKWLIPVTISYTAAESDELRTIKADIATYNLETFLSFIVGTKPLNEETWAEYQNTIKSLDVERAIEIYQATVTRYLAR